MKKSKKIVFSILVCFISVFSFLIPIFVADNTLKVKADTTYINPTFYSSDIIMAYTGYRTNDSIYNFSDVNTASGSAPFLKYSYKLSLNSSNSDVFTLDSYLYAYYGINSFLGDYNSYYSLGSVSFSNSLIITPYIFKVVPFVINGTTYYTCSAFIFDHYENGLSSLTFSSLPSLDIVSVEIGSKYNISRLNYNTNSTIQDLFDNNFDYGNYNYVCYTDTMGFRYTFLIPTDMHYSVSNFPSLFYSYRKYYINLDFSDSQIYDQGYSAGLLDNQQNVYDQGYSAGNTAGYNNGYNAGINDSNQYSFLNLFGAVLDAPVQTLIGLLNFNLLGVNLFALFTGILTIIVFAFIIKTFKGGR